MKVLKKVFKLSSVIGIVGAISNLVSYKLKKKVQWQVLGEWIVLGYLPLPQYTNILSMIKEWNKTLYLYLPTLCSDNNWLNSFRSCHFE